MTFWEDVLTRWFGLALAFIFASSAFAAAPFSASFIGDIAIGGKGTVCYHSADAKGSHTVAAGDQRFEVQFRGTTWQFVSKARAERVAAHSAADAPSYNGHYANTLSDGKDLVKTNGVAWEFFGDKLHLFYAEGARQRWLKGDWPHFKVQADAAWQPSLKQ